MKVIACFHGFFCLDISKAKCADIYHGVISSSSQRKTGNLLSVNDGAQIVVNFRRLRTNGRVVRWLLAAAKQYEVEDKNECKFHGLNWIYFVCVPASSSQHRRSPGR